MPNTAPFISFILKVIEAIVGLRVDTDAELRGLDLAEHSEVGYTN